MPRRKKLFLDYSMMVKLNKEDRQMLDRLQIDEVNASEEVRKLIHKLYNEKYSKEIK